MRNHRTPPNYAAPRVAVASRAATVVAPPIDIVVILIVRVVADVAIAIAIVAARSSDWSCASKGLSNLPLSHTFHP